ncbi:MAG: Ig-like domain-containing protein [Clostridiales bacterium]|nr:Ig-like domain-containing protein [Clostridiales bacterium]
MLRKGKHSFLLAAVLIFTMIFSTVTPMTMTTSRAYAEDGAKAEGVSVKLERYNYGDGVGITPKWVELNAEHQFAGLYEEIKNGHEYGLRAVVKGSDSNVEWTVEEGSDLIKRVKKGNENEYFFNVIGTGHVKLSAKCQGVTNYVEFDVVDKSKEKDELLASWKKGHDEYTEDEVSDWNYEPDKDIPSSGLVLNVGDKICVYLHGRTPSEKKINGHKLEGLDISVDTEGQKDIVQLSNGKDDYYKQERNYYYNITALKPGKAILKFKVGGWIKTEYKLNIPIEVKGDEPAIEKKLDKVDFHQKGKRYMTSDKSYAPLNGELKTVPGQKTYLKPVLKNGAKGKISFKEDKSAQNLEIKDEGKGIFTVRTNKEGDFLMNVLVDDNVEQQIKIVAKKQSPVLHMKEMQYVQHGPTWEWQMQYKTLKTYTAENNVIEEKIGTIRYLQADIQNVEEAYTYTFKVDDPSGVLDQTQLTKASFSDKGLQYRIVNPGEAKVTVSCIGGQQEFIIKVNDVPAKKIEITNAPEVLDIENPLQLKARVTPSESTDKIKWSVDKADICKVSETGLLTPVKEGEVKVTATAGKVKAEAKILIKKTTSTDIYFKDNETGQKTYVKDNKITLKMTDSGKFFMAGQEDNSVFVRKWHAEEYVYHHASDENSFWFWIDQTNRFHPRKVGTKTVRVAFDMGGNQFTKDFTLEVIPGNVEEIKAYAIRDNKEVELGGEPLPVAGSERVKVILKGRNKGEENFNVLPETSYELAYKPKQHIIGSTFALWSPETHTIDIRMLDDTAKLSFKATSSYVPQTGMEGDVPKRWPIHDWNANGDKFNGMRYYTDEQVKEWGFSGFTLRTLPYNASYHSVLWKSLTPDIAEFDPLHENGLVPKKAGKAKFIAYLSENENINREVEVEFYYLHPLKSAAVKEKEIKLDVNKARNLEIEVAPKNASEQRFVWTYSKEGIVKVSDKVNTDPTDVNVDKWTTHSIVGLKDGTVEVTGTPMDSTSGAKPIKFKVVVGKGDPEKAKTTIKFTGNGAADVDGGKTKEAVVGEKVSFKLNKDDAFDYTVTIGTEKLEANKAGEYEIAGDKVVKDGVTVKVEKVQKHKEDKIDNKSTADKSNPAASHKGADKGKKPANGKLPKTSDPTNGGLYGMMILASAGLLLFFGKKRRQEEHN